MEHAGSKRLVRVVRGMCGRCAPAVGARLHGRRGFVAVLLAPGLPALAALFALGVFTHDRAHAAGGGPEGVCGLCVLAPVGQSLTLTGDGSVELSKSGIVVDSASKPALTLTGNATIKAPSVAVVGTAQITGNGSVENLKTGAAPIADPLASLEAPSLPLPSPVPSVRLTGNGEATIAPGVYSEIAVTGNGSLTLDPGTYVILHSFTSTGNGSLSAQGVTLYLACFGYPAPCKEGERGASLSLTGNGSLDLSGPGERCSPVAIFADRANTAPLTLTGNGAQKVQGAIYARSDELTLTGNGGTFVIGGAIDVGGARLTGNGDIALTGALPFSEGLALALSGTPTRARVGETETLSAALACHSKPLQGAPIDFRVEGANPQSESAATNGEGNATVSYTGRAVGTDTATASYTADGASVFSAPFSIEWLKARPTIETKPKAGQVTLGEPIADTATVSGGLNPTGSVSFNVYAAADTSCASPLNLTPLQAPLQAGAASSPPYTPTAPGTYQLAATYSGDALNEAVSTPCGDPSEQVEVKGFIGPVEPQPQSETVGEDSPASFTAGVAADPAASAQWQVSDDGGKTWAADTADRAATKSEAERTTSTLAIAGPSRTENGDSYRAVFQNAAGSITTSAATLTVNWIGPIERQPQGTTVDEGKAASFEAIAAASPGATAQWQVSDDGGKTWSADTTDAQSTTSEGMRTTSTLKVEGAERAQSGDEYRAVFTNTAGSVTSEAAAPGVDWIGPVERQPQGATVDEGQAALFTAAVAANPGAAVQWQVSADGGLSWEPDTADQASMSSAAGLTTSTLTVPHVTYLDYEDEYRAVFTNTAGSVTSEAAALGVNWIGPVEPQPRDQTVVECEERIIIADVTTAASPAFSSCGGVSADPSASFTAGVFAHPGATVQWQVSTDGGVTWSDDARDRASTQSEPFGARSTLTVGGVTRAENGYEYRAVFSNAAGTVISSPATLTVQWLESIGRPQFPTVNEGEPASFTLEISANPPPGIQWEYYAPHATGLRPDTTDRVSSVQEGYVTKSTLTIADANRSLDEYEYGATFVNPAGRKGARAGRLGVAWVGPVTAAPEAETVAAGAPLTFSAAADAEPGASVQWQVSPDGGKTWYADGAGSQSTSSSGGITQSVLMIFVAQHEQDGAEFRAVFSNQAGSVATAPAIATVESAPLESDCTDVYVGPDEGLWSAPANWSTGEVPTAKDVACVLYAGTTVRVSEGSNTAGVLLDAGGLAIQNGSLDLAGPAETPSPHTVEASSVAALSLSEAVGLSLGGELDVTSSLADSGSYGAGTTVSGPGKLVAKAGSTDTISAPREACAPLTLDGATLVNEGTLTFASAESGRAAGTLVMKDGAKLENAGTFNDSSFGEGCGYGESSLYDAGGTTPEVTNTGTFNLDSASRREPVVIDVPFSNEGTVSAQGGTSDFAGGGGGTNGAWEVAAGAALDFGAGSFSLAGGSLSGPGAIGVSGAIVTAAAVDGESANVGLGAGSLAIEGPGTSFSTLALSGGVLSLGGTLDVSSSLGVSANYGYGTTVSGPGKLVALAGSADTIGAPHEACAPLTLDGATLVNEGTLTFASAESGRAAGTLVMKDGAKLENAGTFNDSSFGEGCRYGESSFYDAGGSASAIINTGSFNLDSASRSEPVAFGVAFSNEGTVSAQGGRTEFTAGGVPGQVASGCWYASGGQIALTGGTFLIEAGGPFEVAVSGATVTSVPAGLSGTLEAPQDAHGTVALTGHGEASAGARFALASVTIEATPSGKGEWQPIGAPLTPQANGDFQMQWDTASGAYPDGHYELRAKISNDCRCVKSAYTTPSTVRLANAPLSLSPQSAGPDPIGSTQRFTAMLSGPAGTPLAGKTVSLQIKGPGAQTLQATTNAEGEASFSIVGSGEGKDSLTATYTPAGEAAITSNTATVSWFVAQRAVTSTPVTGNFYRAAAAATGFSAKPGDTPVFSQSFPTIDFNPPQGQLKRNPWFVSPTTRPFTDITTDQLGAPDGAIPAEGNGLQAGAGTLETFEASFTADFNVARAGDVTVDVTSRSGFLLGVGGGAQRVSGAYEDAPASNTSPFEGLPLAGAYDVACCTAPETYPVTIHFPAAGTYPYELDYFQHGGQDLSLVLAEASVTPATSPLSVYVAYADGVRPAASIFPFPWQGSPGVSFVGEKREGWDGGALRFENNSEKPIIFEDVSVDVGSYHNDLWGNHIEVAPHGTTILTQTAGINFDTSDQPTITCTPDGLIPQIHLKREGATTTYADTRQILNTGGKDRGECGYENESTPWTLLGGEPTPINVPIPPAVSLELTPTRISGDEVGQTQKLAVSAHDAEGKPVPGLPVDLHLFGPNGQDINVTTDAGGDASASYVGKAAGKDIVSATASISGYQIASNHLTVPWAVPQAPPPSPPATKSGTEPPSVEITNPAPGSLVAAPTPVSVKVGEGVTSYKSTLTPAGGSAITLASGSGAPPATVGEIEPHKLGEGTYTLAFTATSAGGSNEETETITIGPTPGLPPPAPTASESGAPTLEAITPQNGSVIGVQTAVAAKASTPAGQTISHWKVTLTPLGGSATTLAETGEAHPSQLAVIDPQSFASGTYTLTVRVEASGGGWAAGSETLTLGAGIAKSEETTTTTQTSSATSSTTTTTSTTENTTTATATSASATTTTTATSTSATTTAPALPPSISTLSPPEGAIVRTLEPIKATIQAPEGETIKSWSVSYTGAHGEDSGLLASGQGSPPETLGTLDPTKLPNGTYKLTVIATTSGGAVQAESSNLVVSGNLKLGRFLQTYKDLEAPVSGFDMRLERVYDSTDKSSGDFGVGWHLDLAGFTVQTNGPLGQSAWRQHNTERLFGKAVEEELHEESSGLCAYAYESSPEHTVTVTWPDKHTEVFIATPHGELLNNYEAKPRFIAKPGTNTTSTLEAAEPEALIYGFDGNLYESEYNNYWDPTSFLLRTRDGRKLVLSTETGLVSESDPNGNTLVVGRDGVESSAGPKLAFSRDSQGRITEVTGPSGQHLHYGYDQAGDLTSYTDADGNTTTYAYDGNHDLLSTTGPGASHPPQTLKYNEEGRLDEVIDAEGHATKISTDAGARTESIADPGGKLTEVNTYDERGDPTEEVKAAEGKTLVTKHTYDAEGHLLSTTDPEGNTTTNKWDEAGDLVAQTDANGNTTTFAYDPEGHLTTVIGPDGKTQEEIAYDAEGSPTEVQRADGSKEAYGYDRQGELTSITRPSGVTEKLEYDSEGYPSATINGEGQVTKLSYDSSGQLLEELAPAGTKTSYTYNGDGNLVSVTDGLGHTTTFTYDAFGHELSSTDPLGKTETMSYDDAGRLVKRTDRNGESTSYVYDADGNLTAETSGDGETRTIGYDGFERPISLQNQAQTLGFAYDDDGNITEAAASGVGTAPATTLKYSYDPDGNRTSMTGPEGTTTYAYDAYSRLASLIPAGEPEGKSFQFSYSPTGRLTGLKRPDGITDALSYAGEELTARTSSLGGQSIASTAYDYNPAGLRSSATDGEGRTAIFSYDPLAELTEESTGGGAATYEYDAGGNRKQQSGPAGTATYSYNQADELTSNGTETFAYNPDGELLERKVNATGATTVYGWNARGELTSIHLPNGKSETLAYDPLGRLVSVTSSAGATSYVYDRNALHLEYSGSSAEPAAVYTDGRHTNQLLEMERGGKRYSYLVDGAGSTIALADESGNIAERYSYDAFGNPTATGSLANPFLYAGQMWDREAGLYYDRARLYDPATGRFISRDPVAHVNPYPYVANDPTNSVDPSGAFGLSVAEVGNEMAIESILTAIPAVTFAGIASFAIEQELKDQVQEKIPPQWGEGHEAKEGGGWEWVDPENPRNRVRVDPGNPRLEEGYAGRGPHVHVEAGGSSLNGNGETVPGSNAKHPEAHIPLETYLEWETWDSPTAPESSAEAE